MSLPTSEIEYVIIKQDTQHRQIGDVTIPFVRILKVPSGTQPSQEWIETSLKLMQCSLDEMAAEWERKGVPDKYKQGIYIHDILTPKVIAEMNKGDSSI